MQENAEVLVFQYTYWDQASNRQRTSTLYATEEVIRNGLGVPIHASAIKVLRSHLRDGGIYVPMDR